MRTVPAPFPPFGVGLSVATLLLLAAPAGFAQAPDCAWGEGVVLEKALDRTLLLASDGGAGVFVVTSPVNWFDTSPSYSTYGTLRLHHILEQGVLDPALPVEGVTFYTPPDPTDYQGTAAARAIPDGAGGLYVLTRACNPVLAHLRCWERSVLRLLHVTAAGETWPGWPAAGVLIPTVPENQPIDQGDIATDGAGGVVVAWVNLDPQVPQYPAVRAQRYSASGMALWPGADAGLQLLVPILERHGIRVAGDGAGGAAVVVSGSTATGRYELFASRVLANGSLPWGTTGKQVMTQPAYSAAIQGAAMDANGFVFVSALLTPLAAGASFAATQLLTSTGARGWGLSGVSLGSAVAAPIPVACTGDGYVSMHRDGAGDVRLQRQDLFGTPTWGPLPAPDGLVATWANGATPVGPIAAPDGDVLSVWADPGPEYLGPPTVVRAQELDPGGEIAPGWPPSGALVCGGQYGHTLSDAIGSVGHLFVAFGNDYFPGSAPRVQRLSRAVLDVGPLPSRPLALDAPAPNPSRGVWSARFTLPRAAAVTLEVLDVAGRRVLGLELGELPPGAHVASVGGGSALAPGVYRLRVRAGPETAERTLVRLR